MFKKKFVFILAIMILGLIFALPPTLAAADDNTGPQTWSLNSKIVKSPAAFQMNKNYGSSDNGQTGQVSINSGTSKIWVSDQKTLVDFTFPSGAWILQIASDTDWGTDGNKGRIEIGEWDGSFHSLTPPPQNIKTRFSTIPKYLVLTLFQSESLTMGKNKFMAIKVTNLDAANDHTIRTGEGTSNSYLRSPETGSNFVVLPEMPAVLLLGIGVAALAGFALAKRRLWMRQNTR